MAFAEGRLAPDALAGVESHAVACAHCQDLLAAAVGTGVRARGRAEAVGHSLGRGDQVGRYTVLAIVGRGGMGEVYAAYDPELDRKVALKLMHPRKGLDPDRAQARLLREAKAMAKLAHPNVVAVHDTGQFEGRVYLAMEYVDGTTLTDWLANGSRPRQEVLAVFTAAARGLEAAHVAGLVHRDFKPANVMIRRDGAVRVTDFGLARSLSEGDDRGAPDASSATKPRDPRLTETGQLVGTPLFMAPEQFAGLPLDARTDQFSFCVALYGALYGVGPFLAPTVEALTANVLAGRVEPAPSKSTVPAWLRRVVLRGLSVDPASRWPSMADLVAALQHDRSRILRPRGLAAGLLGLGCLVVMVLARGTAAKAPLCTGGPARLVGVWESPDLSSTAHPRRDEVERAFTASGAPGAPEVWERVAGILDRYRADWLSMYRDACEATQVRHEQPMAILDLRMSCLQERRVALAALTDAFVAADRIVVGRAVDAVRALPTLSRCADRAQLEATSEPPKDDATRKRVQALRERVAATKVLNDTGKHRVAHDMAVSQLAEARAIGYRPLVAETLANLARTYRGGTYAIEDLHLFEDSVWTSLAVGRDDLAVESAIQLAYANVQYKTNGRAWDTLANAIIDRIGTDEPILRSSLLTNEAVLTLRTDPHAAIQLLEQGLAIERKVLPFDHPKISDIMNDEAEAFARLGDFQRAIGLSEKSYQIDVRTYGPSSFEVACLLSNRGEYLLALGHPAEAVELLRRSYAPLRAQLGADNSGLGITLTALGRALLALHKPNDAVSSLERAEKLRQAPEVGPLDLAETRFALARAVWDATGDRGRAAKLARKARIAYVKANDVEHAAAIDSWLAERRRAASSP